MEATSLGECEGSCEGLCDVAVEVMVGYIVTGSAGEVGTTVEGTLGDSLEEGEVVVGTILMASLASNAANISASSSSCSSASSMTDFSC